jgi:hypothetical protein
LPNAATFKRLATCKRQDLQLAICKVAACKRQDCVTFATCKRQDLQPAKIATCKNLATRKCQTSKCQDLQPGNFRKWQPCNAKTRNLQNLQLATCKRQDLQAAKPLSMPRASLIDIGSNSNVH